MTNQEIAMTILQQIGGRRFLAMTGAKGLIAVPNGLQFRLPSNFAKQGINLVSIILTPSDDYTVKFYKTRGHNIKPIATRDGIYCDQLQDCFLSETGLLTHL